MGLPFKTLQDRVLRDATRSQGGTQFDIDAKEAVNSALFRVGRDSNWRVLKREDTFNTITEYTTGTGGGTFTNNSTAVTIVGATFTTDDIQIGRRISLQGSTRNYFISQITGETTLVLDQVFDGTTISGTGTYSILPQQIYNLPVQATHRVFLWHEEFGIPYFMNYITEQDILKTRFNLDQSQVPTHYHMWKENMVIEEVKTPSVITISSSSSSDTNIPVTVFGQVSGFPDFEIITTNASNGTTTVAGSKSFQSVERVTTSSSRVGRITVTANSANDTVSVIPVGNTTTGILYAKAKLFPLPNRIFPMNVYYYKDPYRLVNDGDVHELGDQFDEAIALLAISKIEYASSKADGDKFFALYKDEIASVRKHNVDKMDWFPSLKDRQQSSRDIFVHPYLVASQVGANFGTRTL